MASEIKHSYEDLSRYNTQAVRVRQTQATLFFDDSNDEYTTIEYRHRVLALVYPDGRIVLEQTVAYRPGLVEAVLRATQRVHEQAPEESPGQPMFFSSGKGKTFHDNHKTLSQDRLFSSYEDAVEAGLRPCSVCKPKK